MSAARAFLAAWSLAGLAAAQELAPGLESFDLYRGLHAAGRLEVRVPTGLAERAMLRLLEPLQEDGELTLTVNAEERDPGAVRVLAGLPGDPELSPLALALGVEDLAPGFRILGREFRAPGDALVAVFEDPERAGLPLCLFLANDLELVAAYFSEVPRLWRPWLRVYDDGDLALACALARDGKPRTDTLLDHRARREEYFAGTEPREGGGLAVRGQGSSDPVRLAHWKAYTVALLEASKRVRLWFGETDKTTTELFVYQHLEDFERCLGTSELAVVNRLHARVHVLISPDLPDDAGAGVARAIAREIAGEPVEDWMEDGLAIAAAGRYWGRPVEEWARHLARGGLLPDPHELIEPDILQRLSEHIVLPARAFLIQGFLRAAGNDPNFVRALWKGAAPDEKKLFEPYEQSLLGAAAVEEPGSASAGTAGTQPTDTQRKGTQPSAPAPPAATGSTPAPPVTAPEAAPSFRHGIALVEGAEQGYSSRATGEALDRLRALEPGPDALSLTVFATVENPLAPLCARRMRACYGSASDLALANAQAEGAARGMRSLLLALEVLAGPAGSWADGTSRSGPEDLPEFWERYGRVALHYALLAELIRAEFFSLGANLREVARTEPRTEGSVKPELLAARRTGWTQLLTTLRSAYTGGLTYTARFPSEALEVGFYEQLDYIGLALFPRVPGPERVPDDDELRRIQHLDLEEALELAVRWNRPLLLVQLGFPARAASWNRPYLPRGALDAEAQRRYFACLADVLAGKLENREMLQGFYLWNWPVDESLESVRRGGFSLRDRPVESVLPRLFER